MAFYLSTHAERRRVERAITLDEIRDVLVAPLLSYPSSNRRGPVRVFRNDNIKAVVAGEIVVTVARLGGL